MLQLSCAESLFVCYLLLFFVCCFGPSFGWQHRHSCSGSSIGEDGVGIGEGGGGREGAGYQSNFQLVQVLMFFPSVASSTKAMW